VILFKSIKDVQRNKYCNKKRKTIKEKKKNDMKQVNRADIVGMNE